MDWRRVLFSAEGRIGRHEFWLGFLILFGVELLLAWIPLIPLVALYCWVCLFAKRFHDMGRTGWLAVWPVFVPALLCIIGVFPLIGGVLAAAFSNADDGEMLAVVLSGLGASLSFFLAAFVIWAGFTLWAGIDDSEPGPNRFGAPPVHA